MEFRGIDWRGVPFTFFKSVSVKYEKNGASEILKGEPYKINFSNQKTAIVTIEFYKYLKEPNYELTFDKEREGTLLIEYDPMIGKWIK